jgi:putative glycosyl hydrolase
MLAHRTAHHAVALLTLPTLLTLAGCAGPTASTSRATGAKSAKRGIAYDLATPADLSALAPGVSWWYNWSPRPNASVPADYATRYAMDFYPMLWDGNFNAADVVSWMTAHPGVKYLLVLNEPNLPGQANMTPEQAAQLWPRYEAVATQTGTSIVGPAITWGTMPGYEDPVAWLDAFYVAYRAAQMTDMVATCEGRADVFRYAWFTGRLDPDPHFSSLLEGDGRLTQLGTMYLSLPAS